jgi:hypothetical protein
MTIYYINTGTSPNSGNGDSLRVAFTKINTNFGTISDQISSIEQSTTSTLVAGTYTLALSTTGNVTLNGSQFTTYFSIHPPTFETWVSQGPRAKPLPKSSIFSPLYTPPDENNFDENNFDDDDGN